MIDIRSASGGLAIAVAATLLASCRHQELALSRQTPCPAPTAIPTIPRPHDGAWQKMTHDEKLAYMKAAVLTAEAPLFREYDAKRFAQIQCRTCHGAGVDDGSYRMPNPALPKVVPGEIMAMEQTNPKVFRFMQDVIVPRTAALLGVPEWSHKTMTGLGCFACHAVGEKGSTR